LPSSIELRRLPATGLALAVAALAASPARAAPITSFTTGDLVVSTVSLSDPTAPNSGLDTAAPIVLQQYGLSAGATVATPAGTLTLPSSGARAISGEYGSASEGLLQLSADGHYLTIMGYGVSPAAFNAAANTQNQGGAASPYGTTALGQTTSVTGTANTVVPRTVALIGANGGVDTSTRLTGVFNLNNPRSAATVNGSSFYVSGQGVTGDGTGGVFYATRGATTATPINPNTTTPSGTPNGTANPLLGTETRDVQIVNNGSGNTLYVSRDFAAKGSPNDTTDIRSLSGPGGTLPTSAVGLTATRLINAAGSVTGGNTGSIDLTTALDNNVNSRRNGSFVYLSV
jgi:hypothetical protein